MGLFLKGLGFSVDESIQFFREKFSQKVDSEKFEKMYAYNIRHMYGAEGKKADYKSWSCQKVINLQAPGNQEYHGCPFKVMDREALSRMLQNEYGVTGSQLKEIQESRSKNLYQVACLRLFEARHPNGVSEGVGNHPNAYFNSSIKYFKAREKRQSEKPKEEA